MKQKPNIPLSFLHKFHIPRFVINPSDIESTEQDSIINSLFDFLATKKRQQIFTPSVGMLYLNLNIA
jgi:hypothetical protein